MLRAEDVLGVFEDRPEQVTDKSAPDKGSTCSCSHVTNFPEVAWTGPFKAWREVVEPTTEAPVEYLWAVFAVAAGLTLGRTVWIENPRPIYPNFYCLLLGSTASSKKSTCLWYAAELLRRAGEDAVKVLSGLVSSEGLFEELAAAEGTRALIYSDEFRSLLSVAKGRKATQDLLPKLNSLYSSPYREGITRREKSTIVVSPFVSLLTATPIDYVDSLLDHLDVAGGFLNRFIVIAASSKQTPKPRVRQPSPAEWERVASHLGAARDYWGARNGFLDFSPDAAALWDSFYFGLKDQRKDMDYRSNALTGRIEEHVLKIALLYSALKREQEIGPDALAIAIKLGGWLQATALKTFTDVGKDSFSRAERAVLDAVREAGRIPRRDLQQMMFKKGINGKIFGDVLLSLERNDQVVPEKEMAPSGRVRIFVVYMGTGNT